MHLNPGTLLQSARYRVDTFISSGGFGCTYRGTHTALGKPVAIKEFFVRDICEREQSTQAVTVPTQSQREFIERLRKKFVEEARSIASLSHPGIVHVYDVFDENGTSYYVMDFIEGSSLSERLRKSSIKSPTIDCAWEIMYRSFHTVGLRWAIIQ